MGAFHNSIQIKTKKRGRVLSAVTALAAKRGERCYVGPCLNGWVGVYPSMSGNPESTDRTLAKELGDKHASLFGMCRIYSVAEEADGQGVVFGGDTGRIYRLDLATGQTRELIEFIGKTTQVHGLQMSTDGKSLGIATRTVPPGLCRTVAGNGPSGRILEFWDPHASAVQVPLSRIRICGEPWSTLSAASTL